MNPVDILFGVAITLLFVAIIYDVVRIIDMLQWKEVEALQGVFQDTRGALQVFAATFLIASIGVFTGPITGPDIELVTSIVGSVGILYFVRAIRRELRSR